MTGIHHLELSKLEQTLLSECLLLLLKVFLTCLTQKRTKTDSMYVTVHLERACLWYEASFSIKQKIKCRILNSVGYLQCSLPSTFHICLIFALSFSGAVHAAHQFGVSCLDVRGPFGLAHQPAADKHGPDIHLIPGPTVRSGSMWGQSRRWFTGKKRRTLGNLWASHSFSVSRHGAAKWNKHAAWEQVLHLMCSPETEHAKCFR